MNAEIPSNKPSRHRRTFLSVAAGALVDRSAGEVSLGVPFFPLISLNFPSYPADSLPPELAAITIEDPGSRRLASKG